MKGRETNRKGGVLQETEKKKRQNLRRIDAEEHTRDQARLGDANLDEKKWQGG